MKDRLIDTVFVACTTATYYFVELSLEARGVARNWRIPVSGILSAILVGVLLRYVFTRAWWGIGLLRRWCVEKAALEGLWLEVIDRRGEQHYSIVELRYDVLSQVDRFSMHGWSYYPSGASHSNWHTRYMRIKKTSGGFDVDYIFEVENSKKRGYGASSYKFQPAKPPIRPRIFNSGEGYYLAVEENPLVKCPYLLLAIDKGLKIRLGAERATLDNDESRKEFVKSADDYYGGYWQRQKDINHHQ